ncbi:MAG: CHASE domain-containing protein [Rhodoferax sp.]|uniref:CHASE domain-containing protein n=1 Tax=Rhodoferax sp. TaxID=50421 RepID=UPI002735905A|nr:CHASE domain-containing protein [Rhodoferax sp.]MDP3866118.1 CHASE domain-containing protein [Rhodoferax sp.]
MSAMDHGGGGATGMSLFGTALFTWRSTPAWIVLLAGLLLTALLSMGLAEQRARSADQQFELHVKELVAEIEKRLLDHEQILLGGAGLFDVNGMVTRAQWRTYVERLSLKARYPGIQGVGFSQAIPPDALAPHIAAMRATGFPDYTVRPEGDRALYTSIIYLEPFMGRNLAAFGYDMFSDATRRQAMQRSVDNNTTAISGRVKLVQETHGKEQAGFLMYVPVYRQGMPLNSVEARWQALLGFVYSPYRMDDLMQGILGGRDLVVDFTLHNGESTLADTLMYDSAAEHTEEYAVPPSHLSTRRIDAFGQTWTLSLRSRPAFQAQFASSIDWLIPSLGTGISLLLFALVLSLLGRREQALALAAELAVRKTQKFLTDVLAAASEVAIIATDRDGLITIFNKGAERLLGYSAGEMVGKLTPAVLHVPAEAMARAAELSIELGRPIEGFRVFVEKPEHDGAETREWTYVHKHGRPIPVSLVVTTMRDDSGEITGYLGIAEDITERKQAETALREQAQHTQAVLDNMVDGIITIDQAGIIGSFNPAAERIFGYTPAEVLGRNVRMLMPNPHRDAHDSYLRNYRATGVARIIGIGREVEGQRKDGDLFPMDLAISEVSRQGQPLYVGMVRDITERKRMERMKSEFVSTVSHELRTPLTSISGALGLVAGGALGALPAQAQQMIAIAQKNSQRLTHLINDLLDMEKIAAGKLHFEMQPQALMPLIEQALEANRAYGAERRVTLVLAGAAPSAEVRVDSQRLMQVLANLLSNAIKFSPEGGTVNVTVETTAKKVTVSVADHGPGIPAAFRDRIFQKFSQADASDTRQKGGTGLGLAITRELVERMGGSIGFESVQGDGARFFFELPLWHPAATGAAMGALGAEEAGAPRILVVEDEPDVAQVLGLMLTRGGYQVDVVGSGAEALAALQQTPYAAVSLDLMLPDISGLEVIRQVRQRPETADLPIVVVSAKMEEGRLAINGDFSGIDWLAKPINENRLLTLIERQLSTTNAPHPRVLHVEDDADLHQVVRAMVGKRFDFELATTLQEARARVALERFDVVILDLSLPDGSGWDLLPEIRQRQPETRVVILSGADMTADEARKVEAVLLKSQVSPRELLDALNTRIQSSKPKGIHS